MDFFYRTLSQFAVASALVTGVAHAQSFELATQKADADLRASVKELTQSRASIAAEKLPLSTKLSTLEEQAVDLRRERDQLLKLKDNRTINLDTLRRRVKSLEDQQEFAASRLSEFISNFEARINISESGAYEQVLREAKNAKDSKELSVGEKRMKQLDLVEAAIARMRARVGGHLYEGEATAPSGYVVPGTFIASGPQVYFAAKDGSVGGLVEVQANNTNAFVVPLPEAMAQGLAQIAQGGAGELPADPTLGKALKKQKARKSLKQHVQDGGYVGYTILVLGFVSLLLTLFKVWDIGSFKIARSSQVDAVLEALEQHDAEGARQKAESIPGITGQMMKTGVQFAGEKRGIIEELLFEKILVVRPRLERYLPFLAITAAAAPLMGLLGTVVGMIKTFQDLTVFGAGDAKALSSGISEALVTTEFGLIVAIPVLILHGMLSRMARQKIGMLEHTAVSFVNGVMRNR